MPRTRHTLLLLTAAFSLAILTPHRAIAQSSPQPPAQATSAPSVQPVKPKHRHHSQAGVRPASSTPAAITTIPLETEPPTPSTPASRAQARRQRAADQQVLSQQRAQSDQAAKINDLTVEQAQKQQDAVQSEHRIQDAPGANQTGVAPGATPTTPDAHIQDAPGPAQTLPQPTAPATQPTPQTAPAQPTTPPQP